MTIDWNMVQVSKSHDENVSEHWCFPYLVVSVKSTPVILPLKAGNGLPFRLSSRAFGSLDGNSAVTDVQGKARTEALPFPALHTCGA